MRRRRRQRGHNCGTATCIAGACVRVAFITSASYPTNFGGLTNAETQCQTLAQAAHLVGAFLPWLADDTQSPSTRFTQSQVPYVRLDGVEIAKNWSGLISGTLEAPIAVDEKGHPVASGTEAFTGANADGTVLPKLTVNSQTGDQCCNGWTTTQSSIPPWEGVGDALATSSQWSLATNTGIGGCGNAERLYCFQQ